MVTINIGRKEAIFFGVIILVFVVAGLAVAYDSNMRAGNPPVMGHSAGEVNVENSDGEIVSLQDLIDAGGFGEATWISPWIPLSAGGSVVVSHPLQTKNMLVNVQIKTSNGKIHLSQRGDNCDYHHSATYVDFTTDNSLTLKAGTTGIGFTASCSNIVSGDVRVILMAAG